MRQIGTLPGEEAARTFKDFLLTRGVKSNVEEADGAWNVWIYDEDDVESARQELAEFSENPRAEHFREGARAAADLRRRQEKERKRSQKKVVNMRDRWNRPLSQRAPVTTALIAISGAVVAIGTDWSTPLQLCDRVDPVLSHLYVAPIEDLGAGYRRPTGTFMQAFRNGEIWRAVTPIFLHFGPLHILFNMLWLGQLGAAIESRRGTLRFLVIVLAIAVSSNLMQYYRAGPFFGGMSGVVFGLFGYIWIKSRYAPEEGFYMPPRMVFWIMVWFVVCLTGYVGRIANTAHGVGLVAGMVIGYWPVFLRKMQGR